MNYRRPELRDRLASEYVLGTLQGRARARFQQLLRDDLELRACVEFWERELTPMASPLSVAAPPGKVWDGIAARLASRDRVVPAKEGWLARWLTRWFDMRTLGSVTAGLFLGVTATLIGPSLLDSAPADFAESQLPQSYVGVLATADGRTGLIVSSRRHGKVMDVKQVQPLPVPAGQTLFLWVIEADGKTRPIGPVPQGSFVQVQLGQTSEQLFATASELALSNEPAGSAPALPSGPFVYRGLCGKLWRSSKP
jgi:anti-sigma-K factor RskA